MVSDSSREPDILDARYGRSKRSRTQQKRLGVVAAAIFAVVLVAWVVWAGLDAGGSNMEAKDIAHSVTSDTSVDVTFQLSVPVGTPTYCAVQALNDRFAVVGWKIIDVPASDAFNRTITESVRTTERASTGLIYRCWLA
ncbi:hypothetical protein L1277_000369 [Okibacterium sp. HSC-33S16]|uniref:DUF4307 domain-containing protein n=1 Tax=Okibacterium sp. HSC-33S16 TaxID=2910965 RepID=UPI00209F11A9|nr:DUF4307 domain-containing protein [Okibacterium sp. HSC-33S16]MCP2030305.1 hypothetical protein [Okibacterium sp. HSC-33S16]